MFKFLLLYNQYLMNMTTTNRLATKTFFLTRANAIKILWHGFSYI